MYGPFVSLEGQLDSPLPSPREHAAGARGVKGAGHLAERRTGVDVGLQASEIGVVEDVEHLEPKLEVPGLADRLESVVLHQRDVLPEEARTAEGVVTSVPAGARRREIEARSRLPRT